jgi:cytochrome c oxidase cbb3-type subunit 3
MRINNKKFPGIIILIIFLLADTALYAQTPAGATNAGTSPTNGAEILMIIVALLLAFVIWGLGQVLQALGKQALDKTKKDNNAQPIVMLLAFLFLSVSLDAQDLNTIETVKAVPNYGGMNSTGFWVLAATIFIELVVIAWFLFLTRRLQAELIPQKAKTVRLKNFWSKLDKTLLTKAVAVEKEADILLEHDYDGIQELDNSLPPWWKYGFILTIIAAFVYMINFHVLGGKNPTEEYQEEIVMAQQAKEEYEAHNIDKVDESNLKMPDANGIASGKEIFTTTCWPCHGKVGEGGAGPNLTDDYWLHSGSLTDIYKSIKHGYPDKGMQAWEKNFSPKEINGLAGYIKSLKGTNPPNAKAPQGDIFNEASQIDSTSNSGK